MGKQSALTPLLLLGGALLGYSVLRQGQNTTATLTTGRLAGFQPKAFRNGALECEAIIRFSNTHPTRAVNLDYLYLTVANPDGVVFADTRTKPGQTPLLPGMTTDVKAIFKIELLPLARVVDWTTALDLLKGFTSLGKVMTWLTSRAGLGLVVIEGNAVLQGLVVPLKQSFDLKTFAPPAAKPAPKATASTRGRALTKKVTA